MTLLAFLPIFQMQAHSWKERVYSFLKNQKRVANAYESLYYSIKNVDPVSVPDSDWDNLIILDACRFDCFKKCHSLEGKLKIRYSCGSQTPSFLTGNFADREFHDIVYVTGNPHQDRQLNDSQFHDVFHVWRTHWNQELKTVHPESINEVAADANERYPNKRLIVHYMQPHAPFIGEWARENVGIHSGNNKSRETALQDSAAVETQSPYTMLSKGRIESSQVKRGYTENLELVLEYVEQLLDVVSGKTVVTADHGELFGERAWPYPVKGYGHPPYKAKKLLQVPWFIVDNDERKSVIAEPPVNNHTVVEEDMIEERLQNLGYT